MKNSRDPIAASEPVEITVPGAPEKGSSDRRPYEKPQLVDQGRLADVALGGSPGVGDSSGSFTQQPPGG